MKVSYKESLANDFGLQRRCDEGNNVVLSVCREGNTGQLLSSEILASVCRPCPDKGKAISLRSLIGKSEVDTAESENLTEGKSDMNADGKSDEFVVLPTSANNDATEDQRKFVVTRSTSIHKAKP